jgi:hypothetical protein
MIIEDFEQARWSFRTLPTGGLYIPVPTGGIRVSGLSPDSSFRGSPEPFQ